MTKSENDIKINKDVVMIKTEDLVPWKFNSKKHPPKQIEKIIKSISNNGFSNPILLDENNIIVAGHGRRLAAIKMKLQEVPCIYLKGYTENQLRTFRIADNKVAESEWDLDMLKTELEELYIDNIDLDTTGFEFNEYSDFLSEYFPAETKTRDYEGTEDEYYDDEQVKHEIKLPREELSLPFWDWMNQMSEIYVMFSGGKDSMATLAEVMDHCQKDKIKIFHSSIPMDWSGLNEWIEDFAKKLDIPLIIPNEILTEEQLYKILRKSGVPLNYAKRWCLRIWKSAPTHRYIKKHALDQRDDIVFVEGLRFEEGGVRATAEERSIRKEDNVRIARPILNLTEDEVFKIIKNKKWKRHPVYDIGLNRLGCIFCFATKRREWTVIREKAPEIFLKALRILAEGACSQNVAGNEVVYYLRKMFGLDTVEATRKKDGLPPRKPWEGKKGKKHDD